jgi:hypothetical protein
VRLPGLKMAEHIHAAAGVLVEADWLRPPAGIHGIERGRAAYPPLSPLSPLSRLSPRLKPIFPRRAPAVSPLSAAHLKHP